MGNTLETTALLGDAEGPQYNRDPASELAEFLPGIFVHLP